MKITEVEWGTNKTYVDENGFAWKVTGETLSKPCGDVITNWYNLRGLSSMNFEEQVDWSKVEVDTPILVKEFESEKWNKRHFAKYENEKVCFYASGATSWTNGDYSVIPAKKVKLGDAK